MLASLVRRWAEDLLERSPDAANLYQRLLQVTEPPLLEVVLERNRGQFASAARQLGLHRMTLKKKIDQHQAGS
jgi:two-component system nitrogen regulation response regulator GlnG